MTKKEKQLKNYLKYSGMAIQMGATIYLGYWGGEKLDLKYPNDYSLYTTLGSLLGVGLSLYLTLRGLINITHD